MTQSNKFKRCARELQKVRNCSYTEALEELRELPQGTSLRDYVERVRVVLETSKELTQPSPEERFIDKLYETGKRRVEVQSFVEVQSYLKKEVSR